MTAQLFRRSESYGCLCSREITSQMERFDDNADQREIALCVKSSSDILERR